MKKEGFILLFFDLFKIISMLKGITEKKGNYVLKLLTVLLLSFTINNVFADQYWSQPQKRIQSSSNTIQSFQLDIDAFKTTLYQLNSAPSVVVTLPRLDASLEQFRVTETDVVAPELALKYPQLKTYKIQHLTNSSIQGRMEVMLDKVSVMLKTPNGKELIELNSGSWQNYTVQKKQTIKNGQTFSCGTNMSQKSASSLAMKLNLNSQYRAPINQLTKLRLAIATTVEYSAQFGNTKATVLAEIMKAVNRINEVYERELAITLVLVSTNDRIIFIDNDNLSNDIASFLLDESQSLIDNQIGSINYDLGHVFSTGAGGLASVGSVCSNFKAEGVTGKSNPTADPFWIDYVAHEMGHQLGAQHTFNGTTGSCSGGTRFAATAVEPGSGSSIMAYAGICDGENLQAHSDDSFHVVSIAQIEAAIPSNCGVKINSSKVNLNNPVVSAGNDFTIPINTPFVLTASATDADGDVLSYQWDQTDVGKATSATTIGFDYGDNSLFRSNRPQSNNKRYFPNLATLLSGTAQIGEVLPTKSRQINFSFKVTDGKGGYAMDKMILNANAAYNRFAVTSQSSAQTFAANQPINIIWDTANTTQAPISCLSVEVQLLSFNADASLFSTQTLATQQPNIGFTTVTLPNESSTKSRFLVKCESNVFFAINNAYFDITGGAKNSFVSTSAQSTSSGIPATAIANPTGDNNVIIIDGGGGSLPIGLLFVLNALLLARRYV